MPYPAFEPIEERNIYEIDITSVVTPICKTINARTPTWKKDEGSW